MLTIPKRSRHKLLLKIEETHLGGAFFTLHPPYLDIRQRIITMCDSAWDKWENDIQQIITKEIEGPTKIKTTENNSISQHDLDILENHIHSAMSSNPYLALNSILGFIPKELPERIPTAEEERSFPTRTFISLYWHEMLTAWHLELKKFILKSMSNKFKEKLSLHKGFYNFTKASLPNHMHEILKYGEQYRPYSKSTVKENMAYFTEYTWDLTIWGVKQLSNKTLNPTDRSEEALKSMLQTLAKDSIHTMRAFWQSILNDFVQFKTAIAESCEFGPLLDEDAHEIPLVEHDMLKDSIPEGTIILTADKNYGMVLVNIEDLIEGEKKIMKSLGAAQIKGRTGPQILSQMDQEYIMLRLDTSEMLTTALKHFPPIPKDQQQMPFLKLNPKVHKLTTIELAEKDGVALQYRPICDSKNAPTKPCSQAAASLLTRLRHKTIFKYPEMGNYYPQSGYEVSLKMRNTEFPKNKPYSLIISCDLTDAYTNCHLDDLVKCSRFLSTLVESDHEEQQLIEILADFVLKNSFIESSSGIFYLEPILPMGSCISGEALDIIAMAGEVYSLIYPPMSDHALTLLPEYLSNNGSRLDTDSYDRYRDDTLIILTAGKPEEIINTMVKLATAVFPPKIQISFEYGSFLLSFLDCCFTLHLPGKSFLTYPRLNFTRPSKMVHKSSNSWQPHLMANFMSSNISAFRICNDKFLFDGIQQLLEDELSSAGYTGDEINTAKRKVNELLVKIEKKDLCAFIDEKEEIDANDSQLYEQQICKMPSPFPPTVIYDRQSRVQPAVANMISNCRQKLNMAFFNAPVKPQPTIKQIMITKNIYRRLTKQYFMSIVH